MQITLNDLPEASTKAKREEIAETLNEKINKIREI
jgi:hypothetical protein